MYLVIFNPLYYFICIGKSTYNGSFDFPSVIIIRQFFDTFITTDTACLNCFHVHTVMPLL